MGTDLTVVNAARVSFDKVSTYEDNACATCGDIPGVCRRSPCNYDPQPYPNLSAADTKLIQYLAKHDHWSPFAHTSVQLHVKAPIFIARQLGKHQVGLVWNEVSRRYVDSEPEFYVPTAWRKRAENVKQGSSDETVKVDCPIRINGFRAGPQTLAVYCLEMYEALLADGVCPEQARMVLPQSMMTSYYVTGSLAAFARAYKQRVDAHAQLEIQVLAKQWGDIIAPLYPHSWKALTDAV